MHNRLLWLDSSTISNRHRFLDKRKDLLLFLQVGLRQRQALKAVLAVSPPLKEHLLVLVVVEEEEESLYSEAVT
jgi:hypothetical protein